MNKKSGTASTYRVVGVMSGSSMDGLDLALCVLKYARGKWTWRIEKARTVPYPQRVREDLEAVMNDTAMALAVVDTELGEFIGEKCKRFAGGKADLISSHGHTIFHMPRGALTKQVGSGAAIAAMSGITTVCDFRSTDMALGGQGAPLVPIGEQLLFPKHSAFLNIGGICNISIHTEKRIIGYDVCIGNQALNFLAALRKQPYDADGTLARSGRINADLLDELNALPFHQKRPPRSLGREWFLDNVMPLINDDHIPVKDRLRTVVEHIAYQVGRSLQSAETPVLVTGGGAHNSFLLERIRAYTKATLHVPDKLTVDYKEALVFALLGVLRMRGEVNTLKSVTGAKRDSVGGAVYLA
ncbi:MAG: anhydro-N-acetylmuramic acid kinase [Flavobacteriales bacterium]|nr:anhydro-N-acetylmuramic acid kinase [Flavobacteriales bacterium]MCC6938777.1 anhydro-N-acetylmuramic acid kinase [Flavobacteriales bacterium]